MPRNVLSGCLQSNIARERTQSASSERANHAQSFKGKSECARHCAGTLLKHRGAARQPPWSRALHAPVQRPQGAAGSASGQAARTVPWSSSRSCPGVLFAFLYQSAISSSNLGQLQVPYRQTVQTRGATRRAKSERRLLGAAIFSWYRYHSCRLRSARLCSSSVKETWRPCVCVRTARGDAAIPRQAGEPGQDFPCLPGSAAPAAARAGRPAQVCRGDRGQRPPAAALRADGVRRACAQRAGRRAGLLPAADARARRAAGAGAAAGAHVPARRPLGPAAGAGADRQH